jgi:hypothetical protein
MNWNRLWRFDTEAHLVASDVNDGHHDIVANHDAFVSVAGKDQHVVLEVIRDGGMNVLECLAWNAHLGEATIPSRQGF